jgi:Subtilase family
MNPSNRLFACGAFAVALAWGGAPNADAASESAAFASIRTQPAIAASFDFQPLPANAGKGITIALLSAGVSQSLASQVGPRLSAISAMPDNASPFTGEGETGFYFGNSQLSVLAALVPHARIINIKVVDDTGGGSNKVIENAIDRAVAMGARMIVFPLGSPNSDAGVARAVNNALHKGVLCVSASGNESGGAVNFPASMYGVVGVGAADNGRIATFSSIGEKLLYAPGQDVTAMEHGTDLKSHSGSSHAATVAGAILADLWSQNPKLTGQQLVNAVRLSTKRIDDLHGGTAPLIDAAAALRIIKKGKISAAPQGPEAIASREMHFSYKYQSASTTDQSMVFVRQVSGTVEDTRGLRDALAKLQPPAGARGGYGMLGDDYLLGKEDGYGLRQLGLVARRYLVFDKFFVVQPGGFEQYGVNKGVYIKAETMNDATLGWVLFDLRGNLEADLNKRLN